MVPGQYDFILYQGTNDGLTFSLTSNNVPLNLTGYDVRMQIRKNYDSNTTYFVASTLLTVPNIVVTPLLGKIQVYIYPDDTSVIPFKGDSLECVYDIEIIDNLGEVTRVLMGNVTISREVTR